MEGKCKRKDSFKKKNNYNNKINNKIIKTFWINNIYFYYSGIVHIIYKFGQNNKINFATILIRNIIQFIYFYFDIVIIY